MSGLNISQLTNYCGRQRIKTLAEGMGGPFRISREKIIKNVGDELLNILSRPRPLAIQLKGLPEQIRKQHVLRRMREFIYLANLLTKDRDFPLACMAEATKSFDLPTHEHQVRVAVLAEAVGKKLGLPSESLELAGSLHDIGKLGLSQGALNNTQPWNDEEKTDMKPLHLEIGLTIVGTITNLKKAAGIMRYNHYYDGYPEGIETEDVPLEGQVLSAVDIFDALTNPRPSRKGEIYSIEEAFEIIEERKKNKKSEAPDSRAVKTPYDGRVISALKEVVHSRNNL